MGYELLSSCIQSNTSRIVQRKALAISDDILSIQHSIWPGLLYRYVVGYWNCEMCTLIRQCSVCNCYKDFLLAIAVCHRSSHTDPSSTYKDWRSAKNQFSLMNS